MKALLLILPLALLSSCTTAPVPPRFPAPLPLQANPFVPKPISTRPVKPSTGYIGMSKSAALAKAKAAGIRARIVEENGRRFMVTKDYRPNRMNFVVRGGRIVRMTKG